MAAAALHRLGRTAEIVDRFKAQPQAGRIAQLLQHANVPTTTSTGRLFDAVAGLLGTSVRQRYEGQAAMELEALVRKAQIDRSGWTIEGGVVSFDPLLQELATTVVDPIVGAELFHGTFAAAMVDLVTQAAGARGLCAVALGGGCCLNRVLVSEISSGLLARGITPLTARAVPPNDGGLSLGQAWIASRILDQQQIPARRVSIGAHQPCV
jgi:hydrogenase maturation protein HypF